MARRGNFSSEDIEHSDIIVGVDDTRGDETIFYGKSLLEVIAAGYEGAQGLRIKVLRVPLDFGSDEPEWLAAACLTLKGSCDAPVDEEEG
jgi:hypothetical protein